MTATNQTPTAASITRALRALWPSPIRISTRIAEGQIVVTGPNTIDNYLDGVAQILSEMGGPRYECVTVENTRAGRRAVFATTPTETQTETQTSGPAGGGAPSTAVSTGPVSFGFRIQTRTGGGSWHVVQTGHTPPLWQPIQTALHHVAETILGNAGPMIGLGPQDPWPSVRVETWYGETGLAGVAELA